MTFCFWNYDNNIIPWMFPAVVSCDLNIWRCSSHFTLNLMSLVLYTCYLSGVYFMMWRQFGRFLEISLGDVQVYWGWGGKMGAGKSTRPLWMVAKWWDTASVAETVGQPRESYSVTTRALRWPSCVSHLPLPCSGLNHLLPTLQK